MFKDEPHSLSNNTGAVVQKHITGLLETAKALQPSNIALNSNLGDVRMSQI